jgi:GTP diphosphokinase / guanosine-3',5'-bis(diphosphate) 3'-diphosphatase
MEKEIEELIIDMKRHYGREDVEKVRKAWEFAKLAHTAQSRKSGDPYVIHPLETAINLASWRLDAPTIIAGLLHDTVEDGGAKREDILKEFGEEVATLVDGVTKISDLKLRGSEKEEFVENLRKMFLAMAKDLRVVLIKLADRLHNMKTLSALPKEKQKKIARETLEIYAPLAERLGMGKVKGDLEDLVFPYLYPDEYERVLEESRLHYRKVAEHIKKMRNTLLKSLSKEGIKKTEIQARKKHLYSLWRKLERPEIGWKFDKIYDIVALRVLLGEVAECYVALGVVHNHYKPIPHLGVSDFIAQPKPNGYRSIHTKVFGPGERAVEVQIRTMEMHAEAEHGVAAHWAYGEAKSSGATDEKLEQQGVAVSGKLQWIKQLAEWQNQIKDSEEFLNAVKFDALSHRIYVFSPHGDVFDLPTGATPVDFAFAVHTHLGNYIKSARVNYKIAPLDYVLKSGDVVEILKSKTPRPPSRGWLEFVATTTAKRQIAKHYSPGKETN